MGKREREREKGEGEEREEREERDEAPSRVTTHDRQADEVTEEEARKNKRTRR